MKQDFWSYSGSRKSSLASRLDPSGFDPGYPRRGHHIFTEQPDEADLWAGYAEWISETEEMQ